MTVQHGTALRNARLASDETTIGTAPKFRFYTGSQPANCAAAASGTLLLEFALASDWQGAPSGGAASLLGTPYSTTAAAAGTVGYWRLYDSTGTTCHKQGGIPADGTIDNATLVLGQAVSLNSFTFTEGSP